jgi:hypothetical protein
MNLYLSVEQADALERELDRISSMPVIRCRPASGR